MYGGYGNIWNQATAQWTTTGTLPVQNQNQMTMAGSTGAATATTAVGNATHAYGGGMQQMPNVGGVGMANYGNLNMQAGNPFMNYGNTGMAYNQMANAWGAPSTPNANQQFQQQVYMASQNLLAFPGGRPPLPPGPPPPDKPKEVKQSAAVAVKAPAPPPPPPPSQPNVGNNVLNPVAMGGNILPSILKPEDAMNIIKSAAALGLIPDNGSMSSLNVSEELFGAKKSGQGIPGLDGGEDLPVRKTPEPEVIDLEKDPAAVKKETQTTTESSNANLKYNNKTDNPWTTSSPAEKKGVGEPSLPKKSEKEIVWELRPEVKNASWNIANKPSPSSSVSSTDKIKDPNNHFQEKNKFQNTNTQQQSFPDSRKDVIQAEKSEDKSKVNQKANPEESRVRIPLEPADDKQLVYDRKTLKQFDQKFREWENQFEKWKRDNEKHPNQAEYKKYLDQWNSWREQLVEQRRSILETMAKARLDSKEVILSKFDELNKAGDDKFSETDSVGASSTTSNKSKSNVEKVKPGETQNNWGNNETENPFQTGFKNFEPTTTNLNISSTKSGSFNDMQRKNDSASAPTERILRAGGASTRQSGRNIFEDNFNNDQRQGENPFAEKSSSFASNNSNSDSKFSRNDKQEADLPFEWSLPSKSEDKNPFDILQSQTNNPFVQQTGSSNNIFNNMGQDRQLPSLDAFIKQQQQSFNLPMAAAAPVHQFQSANPFIMNSGSSSTGGIPKPSMHSEEQIERIPRDPHAKQQQPKTNVIITPPTTIRLEANPVGMPLLRAAANQQTEQKADDEFSHLFSRDRGPTIEDDSSNNFQYDDTDFVEDAEVIDYGAEAVADAENSNDSMDLPRGEKAVVDNDNGDEEDFSLEDTEVIDYSGAASMHGASEYPDDSEYYEGDYPPEYEQPYPPFHPGMFRGRGRGGWPMRGRGHFRGPVPMDHPYYGRMPPPGHGFGPGPFGRGRFPPPHPNWYEHDDRAIPVEPEAVSRSPEIVELSPSPPPGAPRVKIAPPEFEGDNRDRGRRRSLSGDRDRDRRRRSRERTRSRSRDRIERVSRRREDSSSDRHSRRPDSPYSSRRDRERERDRSLESRRRHDDRRDKVERDRNRSYGNGRGKRSTSRSPPRGDAGTGNNIVRNPLFPSVMSGMMGSNPASNPAPPQYQTVLIENLLNKPGRNKRPSRLVIIMRGLPGSGKSHIVKLIKEREVENGGKAPRILSLDNYFITEIEKKVKDPSTGAEIKTTVMEYEYDEEREPLYRAQLVRQFKKTIDDGYFSFVIVDGVNEYVRQFEEMATFATQKRFQVYVAEIEENVDVCVKRNEHKRTKDELLKIQRRWERTPGNFIKVDIRSLLQDETVNDDVEMEDVSDVETDAIVDKTSTPPLTPAERGKIGPQIVGVEDIEDEDSGDHLLTSAITSKWDTMEQSQEKLNKLDGLAKRKRNNENSEVEAATSIEMWLTSNLPDDYVSRRQTLPGQKRVRWADIEERREQERMREMGFVVGHTDWNRMMDPTFGSSALTKTKFI